MAEHTHPGHAEVGAPMDYPEHERTFGAFVAFTKLTVLASLVTLLALALFGFGGGAGFWFGALLLVLMSVALGIGLFTKGATKPLIGTLVLGVVFLALAVG